jgi:hypothetical protein
MWIDAHCCALALYAHALTNWTRGWYVSGPSLRMRKSSHALHLSPLRLVVVEFYNHDSELAFLYLSACTNNTSS